MPNVTHRIIYQQLVNQKNAAELRQIVDENLRGMDLTLCTFDILMDGDFPYIFCTVKSDQVLLMEMIGFILNSDELDIEYSRPVFYLPAIIMEDDFEEDPQGLLNKDRIIQHELQHVHDILDYVEMFPDYPENYRKFGMNGDVSIEDLPKSIDMELSKLFYMEPPAARLDHKNGESCFFMELGDKSNSKLASYHCRDVDEFVGLHLKSNLSRIQLTYEMKYSDDKATLELIKQALDKALNKYGAAVYGPDPLKGLEALSVRTLVPLMLAMAKANA